VNDMTNETTPIYEALLAEVGNPVPAKPVDRSYEAILAEAEAKRAQNPKSPAATGGISAVPAPAASSEETPSLAAAHHAG
jgi:hypothetical protein